MNGVKSVLISTLIAWPVFAALMTAFRAYDGRGELSLTGFAQTLMTDGLLFAAIYFVLNLAWDWWKGKRA